MVTTQFSSVVHTGRSAGTYRAVRVVHTVRPCWYISGGPCGTYRPNLLVNIGRSGLVYTPRSGVVQYSAAHDTYRLPLSGSGSGRRKNPTRRNASKLNARNAQS